MQKQLILEHYERLFYLGYDDNPESQGTPILGRKKSFIKRIKYKPKYLKLLDGSCHTEKTDSGPNIARSTSFLVTIFPSFHIYKTYKDVDDLSFIITHRRLLIFELFEYSSKIPKQI
jgi:hypothetical protein